MWYFAWMLGLPLAAVFAVLNAMWYEIVSDGGADNSAFPKRGISVE